MAKGKVSGHKAFTFHNAWQCVGETEAEHIRAFWLRENANVEGEAADQRVHQVVSRVLNADGELVAVSTVVPKVIPRLLQPMYYFRCFVGVNWRRSGLGRRLLCESFDYLEAWAREHDFPCIGVLLELENLDVASAQQNAQWTDAKFSFIGRSRRGLDLRVRYFTDARLKTQQEMQALLAQAQATPQRTVTN